MFNSRITLRLFLLLICLSIPIFAFASETDLLLPDLSTVQFLGMDGHTLLTYGLLLCVLGLVFGFAQYAGIRKLPVHKSMKEVSELIYTTCKTYLVTQGKFLILLEILIGIIIILYFGILKHLPALHVIIILASSVIGILGSFSVAWYGMRVNTFANSRSAFASLKGKPYPTYEIPIRAGMSVGMMLISVELLVMLCILLFIPGEFAGACFIGFAIGESLGAAVLRIAGGIFTKIADIGADLMKIVFNIKEDDARNPGVIADCTGDNAGDSVGPTADGFETYGVTGVALISFIVLAVPNVMTQVTLLVWIFVMRLVMLISSGFSYFLNGIISKIRYQNAKKMHFEDPLSSLVWITSFVSIILIFILSYLILADHLADPTLWWKLAGIITCGTLAGAIIPEIVKIFTSTKSAYVKNILISSKHGGPSLNILSGIVTGNYSAYWIGLAIIFLMGTAFVISTMGLSSLMIAPAVFAFGLVAFGFLSMGPVTIAVDSYGPVTDNAQSVYELSLIETIPNIKQEIEKEFGFTPDFENSKAYLEENDGAGNTFKATAKPVLIGTAVVGATTMIFSIIMILTHGMTQNMDKLSILNPPFLLGLLAGGTIIFWFTGATMNAVTGGAYRAVEFIKSTLKLDGVTVASTKDSKKVVEICTKYAQKGMINIFMAVFFTTLSYACLQPFFFIGYLISIALFGLFQAIYMANAGGAWDNAKKIVETDLRIRGPLHEATVIGDTVGDPFKDTSSVAMNPVIKFTTLFGLLALELALTLTRSMNWILSVIFFLIAVVFVYRSFTSVAIKDENE